MAKQVRLTQQLNLALARASAAITMGKSSPEYSQRCLTEADDAVEEAQKIMNAIARAAATI